MKIAFDIGGVLSKYPDIFRPFLSSLQCGGVEVHIITDMHDHEQTLLFLKMNGFDFIPAERVHNSDYSKYGELCKAVVCKEHGISVLVDDHPGYVAEGPPVRLLIQADPRKPYYAREWKTDGSEGDFGRHAVTEDL